MNNKKDTYNVDDLLNEVLNVQRTGYSPRGGGSKGGYFEPLELDNMPYEVEPLIKKNDIQTSERDFWDFNENGMVSENLSRISPDSKLTSSDIYNDDDFFNDYEGGGEVQDHKNVKTHHQNPFDILNIETLSVDIHQKQNENQLDIIKSNDSHDDEAFDIFDKVENEPEKKPIKVVENLDSNDDFGNDYENNNIYHEDEIKIEGDFIMDEKENKSPIEKIDRYVYSCECGKNISDQETDLFCLDCDSNVKPRVLTHELILKLEEEKLNNIKNIFSSESEKYRSGKEYLDFVKTKLQQDEPEDTMVLTIYDSWMKQIGVNMEQKDEENLSQNEIVEEEQLSETIEEPVQEIVEDEEPSQETVEEQPPVEEIVEDEEPSQETVEEKPVEEDVGEVIDEEDVEGQVESEDDKSVEEEHNGNKEESPAEEESTQEMIDENVEGSPTEEEIADLMEDIEDNEDKLFVIDILDSFATVKREEDDVGSISSTEEDSIETLSKDDYIAFDDLSDKKRNNFTRTHFCNNIVFQKQEGASLAELWFKNINKNEVVIRLNEEDPSQSNCPELVCSFCGSTITDRKFESVYHGDCVVELSEESKELIYSTDLLQQQPSNPYVTCKECLMSLLEASEDIEKQLERHTGSFYDQVTLPFVKAIGYVVQTSIPSILYPNDKVILKNVDGNIISISTIELIKELRSQIFDPRYDHLDDGVMPFSEIIHEINDNKFDLSEYSLYNNASEEPSQTEPEKLENENVDSVECTKVDINSIESGEVSEEEADVFSNGDIVNHLEEYIESFTHVNETHIYSSYSKIALNFDVDKERMKKFLLKRPITEDVLTSFIVKIPEEELDFKTRIYLAVKLYIYDTLNKSIIEKTINKKAVSKSNEVEEINVSLDDEFESYVDYSNKESSNYERVNDENPDYDMMKDAYEKEQRAKEEGAINPKLVYEEEYVVTHNPFEDGKTFFKLFQESHMWNIMQLVRNNPFHKVSGRLMISKKTGYVPIMDFESGVRVVYIDLEDTILNPGMLNIGYLAYFFVEFSYPQFKNNFDVHYVYSLDAKVKGDVIASALVKAINYSVLPKWKFIAPTDDKEDDLKMLVSYTTSKKDIRKFYKENSPLAYQKPKTNSIGVMIAYSEGAMGSTIDTLKSGTHRKYISNLNEDVDYMNKTHRMILGINYVAIKVPQLDDPVKLEKVQYFISQYTEHCGVVVKDGIELAIGALIKEHGREFGPMPYEIYVEFDQTIVSSPTIRQYFVTPNNVFVVNDSSLDITLTSTTDAYAVVNPINVAMNKHEKYAARVDKRILIDSEIAHKSFFSEIQSAAVPTKTVEDRQNFLEEKGYISYYEPEIVEFYIPADILEEVENMNFMRYLQIIDLDLLRSHNSEAIYELNSRLSFMDYLKNNPNKSIFNDKGDIEISAVLTNVAKFLSSRVYNI